MREKIMEPEPGLRVFPEPADVFVADQVDLLGRHLHPLVSIDLGQVDAGWSGWVHLLSPLEPNEGYLGDHTSAFHSPLQTANWLGFAVEDDRYRLVGDIRYFQRATTPDEVPDPWEGFRADLDEHCQDQERSYRAHRESYQREGSLIRLDADGSPLYGTRAGVPLLGQLGGDAPGGNWEDPDLFPLDIEMGDRHRDGRVWPLSPAGNRFHFVATVPGWHYRTHGADSILLFFEPVERLALLTFDWS
ncbi:hypothetical protein [Phytohabitans kaempferiae]|uniref:Uncharacterized protein n=1 Tax=Phytohabitans kaempferiae TaxID=1620943 RepID=A0ABV6M5A9_9ACTN